MNLRSIGMALLAVFILVGAGFQDPVRAGEKKKKIPIKGWIEGNVTVSLTSEEEMLFRVESSGTGCIRHLGWVETTWVIPEVQLDMQTGQLVVAIPEWFGTITTTDGDQIIGEYVFPAPTVAFSTSGDLSFQANLSVVDGTGRFAGATGHGVSAGTANIFTGEFNIEVRGTVFPVGRQFRRQNCRQAIQEQEPASPRGR